MKALTSVGNALKYVWEGASRIFSPSHDEYPAVGVQPYEGDTPSKVNNQTR